MKRLNYSLIVAVTILLNSLCVFAKIPAQKNIYIDAAVKAKSIILLSVAGTAGNESPLHTFELFSHGQPGELLINGKWLGPAEIASFIGQQIDRNAGIDHVNIYGCEFARGDKGLRAVASLEKILGMRVAASTNITGQGGDWKLETGEGKSLEVKNYPYSLQTVIYKQSFETDQNGIQGHFAQFVPDNANGFSPGAQGIGPPAYDDFTGAAEGSRYWFTTTPLASCSNCSGQVFSTNISVQANHNYQVKLYYKKAINGVNFSYGNLVIAANGTQLGNVTTNNGGWTQLVVPWNSGGTTSVNLTINDLQSAQIGNDFMLDDIELVDVCGTVTAPSVVSITQPTCATATGSVVLGSLPTPGSWTITRTPGGITYNGAGTSTTISGLASGSYTFTVTNAGGCTSVASANVTINTAPTPPNAGGNGSTTVCSSSTSAINLFNVITGAQAGGVWTRLTGTGGVFNAATGTFTPAAGAVSSSFQYTIAGTGICASASSVATILIVAAPNAGTDGNTNFCSNSTGTIILASIITGEQTGGSWTRLSGTGGTFNAAAGTFNPSATTSNSTFQYTVAGTAPCGNASSIATVTITTCKGPDLTPVIQLGDNSFTAGAMKEFVVEIDEINLANTTTGSATIRVTIPPGYQFTAYNNTQTQSNVPGSGIIPVNNNQWQVLGTPTATSITLIMVPGAGISGGAISNIGFKITRANQAGNSSGNITVNIFAGPSGGYDTNVLNNLYTRIITAI